jgi:phosphoenolpyruvate carboxykinase (GTP)
MSALTTIDPQQWQLEIDAIGEYLETYGDRLPEELRAEQQSVAAALKAATIL